MDIRGALLQGSQLLERNAIAAPRLTAEVLLCHAVGCERPYLFAHPEREISNEERLQYGLYLDERLQGKPTQYITGRQEFYGREFRVTPDVLIPRPETEHVVAIARAVAPHARRIADAGTGSGILAITLRLETGAAAWGTDVSLPALRVARENARRLHAAAGFIACDLLSAFRPGTLDLVVSNPPYVPLSDAPGLQREVRDWEPHVALFAGATGLEIYRRLVEQAALVLRPAGWLVVELGFGTVTRVAEMLGSWTEMRIEPDLAGIPRVLAARRPSC